MPGRMFKKTLLLPGLVLTLVMNGMALAENDHREPRRLMDAGEILPLQQIIDRIVKENDGRLLEAGLEHEQGRYIYEIELLGKRGRVWEFKLDAATGEVLERELED